MFLKLNNKSIFFFFKKHFKIFTYLILKKNIKKFLCFHRYQQQIYSLKMYLKGYNYRIRFNNNKRILQLSLGHPLPFYIKLPLNVKIIRLKKKYYRFISND
jgi:hypothetical protein